MITAMGADPVILALAENNGEADAYRFAGAEVRLGRVLGPAQIGYSQELGQKLYDAELDLLHLHGIWMATSHLAACWAVRTKRPYVISPHGMLDPWITDRGRAKKYIARLGYEYRSWKRASLFHALTQAEAADIKRESNQDAVVIPNAVSLVPANTRSAQDKTGIIYLGRIHPKKNISALLDAWCLLAHRSPGFVPTLTIAGWGEEPHIAEVRARVDRIADQRLRFIGPVFGDEKRALLADAGVLALPSFSEGLPMAILEAWAAGVPTAMSTHCHLPEGFEAGAAVDSGTDVKSIAAALAKLTSEDTTTNTSRQAAAQALVREHFSVDAIQDKWSVTYKGLLEGK
jgi:glycosyltransferase involved in cell wall biosynthesis